MAGVLDGSNRIMCEEARKLGLTYTAFGTDDAVFLMEGAGVRFYTRCSQTSLQSAVGRLIAQNKILTKQILEHHGLPAAKGVCVQDEQQLTLLNDLVFPVVMKPIDGKQGVGVVVGLPTADAARQAFAQRTGSAPMLFEEMLRGQEYRVVCVDYRFFAAAYRKPAFVTGDGRNTIRELIEEKNRDPRRAPGHTAPLSAITVDAVVTRCLAESGYTLDSVPGEAHEVPLRKTANLSLGGESHDKTDEVCAENRALFERIARACDLNVIGIDFMCENIAIPAHEQAGAGIIEVNASPGLRTHHLPVAGKPRNVAGEILKMTLAALGHR